MGSVLLPALMDSGSPATATGRHALAAFRAGFACGDAVVHVADFATALGALAADFRADAALQVMLRRVVEHQRGGGPAHFRATEHQAEVLGLDVFASQLQAMHGSGLLAGAIAVKAQADAFVEFGGCLLVGHGDSPEHGRHQYTPRPVYAAANRQ
jgi:hypothetical protein